MLAGLAHLLQALHLLDADIEQADGRPLACRTGRAPWRCPSPRDRPDARRRRRCEAPRSSTIDSPRTVGQRAAIAGRSMPAMVLSWNLASAISAPVLPAETARSASPRLTASIASDIEDFQRPWRSAWLGLASIAIATSVWMMRDAALSCGSRVEQRLDQRRGRRTAGIRCRDAGRARSAAPGTITDGPKSPPMASSAIRTLSGMDDLEGASAGAGPWSIRQSPTAADHSVPAADRCQWARFAARHEPPCSFLSAASAANGCRNVVVRRPARSNIDVRLCADTGRSRGSGTRLRPRRGRPRRQPAVPARRRQQPCCARRPSSDGSTGASGDEDEIDRLLDLVLDRLERHHAGLPDRRRDAGRRRAGRRGLAASLEARFQARQRAQADRLGHGRARALIGHEVDVPPVSGTSWMATGTLHGGLRGRGSRRACTALGGHVAALAASRSRSARNVADRETRAARAAAPRRRGRQACDRPRAHRPRAARRPRRRRRFRHGHCGPAPPRARRARGAASAAS